MSNGMAPWSTLEDLHRLLGHRLLEALQPGRHVSAVTLMQARQYLDQSGVTARPLEASERLDMETLRAAHIKAVLKAMEAESPPALIVTEARALWESMREQGHMAVLDGAEMPFQGA